MLCMFFLKYLKWIFESIQKTLHNGMLIKYGMSDNLRQLKTITIILSVLLIASTFQLYVNYRTIESQNNTIAELTGLSQAQQEKIAQLEFSIAGLEQNLSRTEARLRNETETRERLEAFINLTKGIKIDYFVLAVDENNRGHVIPLEVIIKEGKGNLFINVANVVVDETLQSSAQIAVHVARDITKTSLIDKDVLINIKADEPGRTLIIAGGSAGAAMTLATMAAMQGTTIRDDVLITGTVNFDHSVGRIGEARAKGLAARENGATIFLVPQTQKNEVGEIGIEVREIRTIEDAAMYALP